MFYLSYMASELRRRKGRTLLTALGLGVGVGLVVSVSALSAGLDKAQEQVLRPLTGVGTDLSVTRPLKIDRGDGAISGPGGLSGEERDRLRAENGPGRMGLANLGEPGEKFTRTDWLSAANLTFPQAEIARLAKLDGVEDAAASLTLSAITVSGTVPEKADRPVVRGFAPGGGSDEAGPPRDIDLKPMTVTGIDAAKGALAPVRPDQVTKGRYLSATGTAREALLNVAYAQRNDLSVGDTFKLGSKTYEVVGLSQAPLGGQASDAYIPLAQLQKLSDREGRVNTAHVRADSAKDVTAVEAAVERTLDGASVTTAKDLAERVEGSLVDAKNLSGKLGTVLTIVGLAAAFLIACLLTLSSVTKRIRELGTLKALGWPQRLVVRQVAGESLLQGALGAVVGIAIGVGGAALIGAVGPELKATVAQAAPAGPGGGPALFVGGPGGAGRPIGESALSTGSTRISLDAPVDLDLILVAALLALLGGLIAGSAGGLRAARLRPAAALRHID